MINKRLLLYFFLVFFSVLFVWSNNIRIDKYINPDIIKKATAPIYTDKGIIITISSENIFDIYIRSDIDNWSKDYKFSKNYYGVYWCFIPYNSKKQKYLYRININGFWSTNPYTDEFYEDNYGNLFSILYLPEQVMYEKATPIVDTVSENVKKVRFQLYFPEASYVNIVISYDNYSSFSNSMEKDNRGYWLFDKILGRGLYKYYFIVDGKKMVDSNNKNKSFDVELGETSLIEIR